MAAEKLKPNHDFAKCIFESYGRPGVVFDVGEDWSLETRDRVVALLREIRTVVEVGASRDVLKDRPSDALVTPASDSPRKVSAALATVIEVHGAVGELIEARSDISPELHRAVVDHLEAAGRCILAADGFVKGPVRPAANAQDGRSQ